MYDASTVKTQLIGLIGWRQNIDPSGVQLTSLTSTSSGLYYNDVHAVLQFDNLLSIGPDYDAISGETDTFTDWLQRQTESGIIRTIDEWIVRKSRKKTLKTLLSREQLFRSTGRISDTITDQGKIVGFEIVPIRRRGVITKIEKIGLQFDTNETITIKLFRSDTLAAIQSSAVSYTGGGSIQWEAVNWELPGPYTYYVVYEQSEIAGMAINGVKDYSAGNGGISTYAPEKKYFQATPFEASGSAATLWDIADNSVTWDTNYGLNMQLSTRCDYTDLIVDQAELLKSAISLGVAIQLMERLVYNPQSRVNRHETNVSKQELLFELYGDTQGPRPGGLKHRFYEALDSVAFDETSIDNICLPCRAKGLKYKSL